MVGLDEAIHRFIFFGRMRVLAQVPNVGGAVELVMVVEGSTG